MHKPDWTPALLALCAGYELGTWRQTNFVDEIFNWLPSFVLPWSEQQQTLADGTAVELLRLAAQRVYETDKYSRRGEFGELILHGVLRQQYGTDPAITKFWFKDAVNDTVKGVDVVHVSRSSNESNQLHLWLGEAKFYEDLASGVKEAISSVKQHVTPNFMKTELALVAPKIDREAPFAIELLELIDKKTPLDHVFDVLHVPILVTFNSTSLAAHNSHCQAYADALEAETHDAWRKIAAELSIPPVVVHAIFVPLLDKQAFLRELHERLKLWQKL